MSVPIPIGIQPGTRLLHISRHSDCWDVWTAVRGVYPFAYGHFLRLFDNGKIEAWHVNGDEPPDVFTVKPGEPQP